MKRTADAKLSHFFTGGLGVRLHVRNDLHLARKAWHMLMGSLIAFSYFLGADASTMIVVLGFLLALDFGLETLRLRNPAFNEKCVKFWGPLMRTCEIDRMSGTPHYLLATTLAIGIFPKPVAVLSILYLAWGDPMASLFGILYGHKGIRISRGKSLIGTLAGVATCALVTLVFLKTLQFSDGVTLALTLVGGLAGGMAELFPTDLDDNLTIPVISGFTLWLAFILFGI